MFPTKEAKKFAVLLFSGSSDKTNKIWDAYTGECLRKLEGQKRGIESIVYKQSSEFIYS